MIKSIIKKAKNGDKQAFEKLILYYQIDLYKIAKAHLIIEEDVNDAVQETILSAYTNIKNLDNISKFKSWLMKILINECNSIYRKRNRENNLLSELSNPDNYTNLDSTYDSNLEFYNLLNRLDFEEKNILILYFLEGYKPKEIAQITGLNNNTVRSKILRAKNKIKDDLKEVYNYE